MSHDNESKLDEIFDSNTKALTSYTDGAGHEVTDFDLALINVPDTKKQIKELMFDIINGTDERGILAYVDAIREKVEKL